MGFNIGNAIGGAAAGTAMGGPVGGMIGGGLGLISGLFDRDKNEMTKQDYADLREQAWGYEKEGMGLQYGWNKKSGDDEYKRNLDMWNATNYEAQREHLEKAGLSAGLFYGNGGGMNASSSGGSQSGVSAPSNNPMGIQMQKEQIELQKQQIESQVMLNTSQAAKNTAEAKKISGVDTQESASRTSMNKINEKLMNSEIEINSANITKLIADGQIAMQKYNQELNNTDISNEIKQTVINQAMQDYKNSVIAGTVNIAKGELTEKQTELIEKEVDNYIYELTTKRMSAEAATKSANNLLQSIENTYEQTGRALDIEEKKLTKEWILGGTKAVTDIIGSAGMIKGAGALKKFKFR